MVKSWTLAVTALLTMSVKVGMSLDCSSVPVLQGCKLTTMPEAVKLGSCVCETSLINAYLLLWVTSISTDSGHEKLSMIRYAQ